MIEDLLSLTGKFDAVTRTAAGDVARRREAVDTGTARLEALQAELRELDTIRGRLVGQAMLDDTKPGKENPRLAAVQGELRDVERALAAASALQAEHEGGLVNDLTPLREQIVAAMRDFVAETERAARSDAAKSMRQLCRSVGNSTAEDTARSLTTGPGRNLATINRAFTENRPTNVRAIRAAARALHEDITLWHKEGENA